MDTIYALASARGKAGVAVIRLSGPLAHEAGRQLAGSLPEPRETALRLLRNAEGEALDQALVLRFDAGASFTGEDTVEFHLHGSTAVIGAVPANAGPAAGSADGRGGGIHPSCLGKRVPRSRAGRGARRFDRCRDGSAAPVRPCARFLVRSGRGQRLGVRS